MSARRDRERVDLVVVGGGIVGVQAALLAQLRHPEWSVELIERSAPAAGASGRSAGLCLPGGSTPRQRELARLSAIARVELATVVPDLPIRPLSTRYVTDLDGLTSLRDRLGATPYREGLTTDLPSFVRHREDERVVICNDGHIADVPGVVAQMIAAFVRLGGRLRIGADVVGVDEAPGGHESTLRIGRVVRSKRLLVATGPWLDSIPPSHRGHVRTKRIVAFEFDVPPGPTAPLLYFWNDEVFLAPLVDPARWLLSIRSDEWDVTPSQRMEPSPVDIASARDWVGRRAPKLGRHRLRHRVFCDGYPVDDDPMLIPLGTKRTGYALTGCRGSGYRLGCGLALDALQQLDAE